MSEYAIKLGSKLPKGDPNGWDDLTLAEDFARTVVERRQFQPRAAILIYDVAKVDVGTDGTDTVNLRIRRVQPVLSDESRRAIEQILMKEYREQTGASMLPFEVDSVTKAAFVDLPKSDEEIDAQEAEEQDNMSPTDELRRHLERVHGVPQAHLLTAEEADAKHQAEHDGEMDEVLAHAPEWLGWTRADLEAAEAEADGQESGASVGAGSGDPDEGDEPYVQGGAPWAAEEAGEDSVILTADDEADAADGVLRVDFSGRG